MLRVKKKFKILLRLTAGDNIMFALILFTKTP